MSRFPDRFMEVLNALIGRPAPSYGKITIIFQDGKMVDIVTEDRVDRKALAGLQGKEVVEFKKVNK